MICDNLPTVSEQTTARRRLFRAISIGNKTQEDEVFLCHSNLHADVRISQSLHSLTLTFSSRVKVTGHRRRGANRSEANEVKQYVAICGATWRA